MNARLRLPWPAARLLGAALLLSAAAAQGQPTYKCTRDGSPYYSDRPCEADAKPLLNSGRAVRPEAPAHWRHLSGQCRQLAERLQRLQTAASVADGEARLGEQLSIEQERYHDVCWDDEQQARRRLVDLARDENERQKALQQQNDTLIELCTEMRRIRDLRRPRLSSMTVGERADFDRFETNFNTRCPGVLPR